MWGFDTNFRVNLGFSSRDLLICKRPRLHCTAVTISGPRKCIQFRKSVAWLAMLNLQEPGHDHLTASAQPLPIVFNSMLFTFKRFNQRNHLQCHGCSLKVIGIRPWPLSKIVFHLS